MTLIKAQIPFDVCDETCRACRAARRNTHGATSATRSRCGSAALTHLQQTEWR